MNDLNLRPADECRFDVVVLGEVMLRLDPGHNRIRTTRQFSVSEGGGEYNVGRSLRRVFAQRAALVTAIGNNEVGWLLEDLLLQGGMNLDHIVWKQTDNLGRAHRNALYFAEQGFGIRSPRAVYDRAASATCALSPDDVDWDDLFGRIGARWLHTGGIFAGLSDSTHATCIAAMDAARRHGTIISFDVNFRPKLWSDTGGAEAAQRQADDFATRADVLFGVADLDAEITARHDTRRHPSVVANLIRTTHTASLHDLRARAWSAESGFIDTTGYNKINVLDRIGSGDAFAAGVIAGLLNDHNLSDAIEAGLAHAALTMTTPGDTSSSDADEINNVITGSSGDIGR